MSQCNAWLDTRVRVIETHQQRSGVVLYQDNKNSITTSQPETKSKMSEEVKRAPIMSPKTRLSNVEKSVARERQVNKNLRTTIDQQENEIRELKRQLKALTRVSRCTINQASTNFLCSICLQDCKIGTDHNQSYLKCGHSFGLSCITRWFRDYGEPSVCPTCNQSASICDISEMDYKSVLETSYPAVAQEPLTNTQMLIQLAELRTSVSHHQETIKYLRSQVASWTDKYHKLTVNLAVAETQSKAGTKKKKKQILLK